MAIPPEFLVRALQPGFKNNGACGGLCLIKRGERITATTIIFLPLIFKLLFGLRYFKKDYFSSLKMVDIIIPQGDNIIIEREGGK